MHHSVWHQHVQCRGRIVVLGMPGLLHQRLWRVDLLVRLGLPNIGLGRFPRLHAYV